MKKKKTSNVAHKKMIAKEILSDEKVMQMSKEIVKDFLDTLCGDKIALLKLSRLFAGSPFFVRDRMFWVKFRMFLDGVCTTEEERAAFSARISAEGKEKDTAEQILNAIEQCETEGKIKYIISAAHCWVHEKISTEDFVRAIHIIKKALLEDLDFVKNNDLWQKYKYSEHIQGLLDAGLMYQSLLNGANSEYSFLPFAQKLDMYALSFAAGTKYGLCNVDKRGKLPRPAPATEEIILKKVLENSEMGIRPF